MNLDVMYAVSIIRDGGIVAFPTETVYGLGADATNDAACKQIYELKQRPSNNPLIVHVAHLEAVKRIADFNEDAAKLVGFWPGPLTMVLNLKKDAKIAPSVLAGLSTVAVRIPSHSVARALLRNVKCPIAAPSANLSGYISASNLEHVEDDFGDGICILPNNHSNIGGLESTIIDLSTNTPTILRHGFITKEALQNTLKKTIFESTALTKIKAPGMMIKHYAPHIPIRLNATSLKQGEVGLNFGNSNLNSEYNLSRNEDLIEAAQNLYLMLREIDFYGQEYDIHTIAVAPIPNDGIGVAINDRLKRAAYDNRTK